MIKIYVYGAGLYGHYVLKRIKTYYEKEIDIVSFIDKNKTGELNHIPIIRLENACEDFPVVVAIDNRYVVSEIYRELRQVGVEKIFMFLNRDNPRYDKTDFFKSECALLMGKSEDYIPHIEMHAVDYCNLNCKACIHFSALYSKEEQSFDTIFNDIDLLSGLTTNIVSFYIMGGEPLLRDDLSDVIRYARKTFPYSDIQVLTNGLLISKEYGELLCTLHDTNVTLTVSEYKPTQSRREEICKILSEFRVPYIIRKYDSKNRFIKTISISADSLYPKTCICRGCVNIYKGLAARCPAVMYLKRLNDRFNLTLPEDGIRSLDEFESVDKFNSAMSESIPLCEYCVYCEIEWEQCGLDKKMEDFLVVN
ncbi:4Fe-4S single cluster domain-containing protein [Lachnospiraceae bacterium]|nr:4Fe-4S single cluster domain-containing protein [Lachnospiraceae bacterium]